MILFSSRKPNILHPLIHRLLSMIGTYASARANPCIQTFKRQDSVDSRGENVVRTYVRQRKTNRFVRHVK